MKILIIGAAGAGKTHLFHLLLNKSPPDVRHSTPVMEKPVQVIQTALKNNCLLENVTDQKLYELLAHTVNTTARHNEGKQDLAKCPLSLSSHFNTASSAEASINENTQNKMNAGPLLHGSEHAISFVVDNSEVNEPKMEHAYNSDDIALELLEVEEQLVPYIAKAKDADPILDVDWIYFIDSGGQPQFHQLLPACIYAPHQSQHLCPQVM